ncbi:ROK family protein [Embleya sp. NBC_00896]|uniref:ROK family transcriptional regulator n=1 Tax=Embleya sp. NBC_00896 TaxID=2975961 RepID=UPI00386E850D|nr:ROK family transcriptional regulator [Embleya sp. NBC_00896]
MSTLVTLVGSGRATTRTELAAATGVSRTTVTQRIGRLIDLGLLIEHGNGRSDGGRPPTMLSVDPAAGVLLAADLGATHCLLAVSDLGGNTLLRAGSDIDIDAGPTAVLRHVREGFDQLLAGVRRPAADVRGIGIGVPGPVEFSTGTVVRPPIMSGWDGACVPELLGGFPGVPILVDNDVNVMALGEHRHHRDVANLLYIKIGTGIGCGIVTAGRLYRGTDGAAGDIGHIRLPGHENTVCHCGKTGCVEAVASGAALVRELRAQGLDVTNSRDIARLALEGNATARRAVRIAGRRLGEVLAAVVSFHNPGRIVIGGAFDALAEDLLAEIKAVVYRGVLPLATRSLRIEAGALGDQAAIVGATALALEHALSPAGLAPLLN